MIFLNISRPGDTFWRLFQEFPDSKNPDMQGPAHSAVTSDAVWSRGSERQRKRGERRRKRKQVRANSPPLKGGSTCFLQGWSGFVWFILARLFWLLSRGGSGQQTWQSLPLDHQVLLWLVLDQPSPEVLRTSLMLCRMAETTFREIGASRASKASRTEEVTTLTAKQHFPSHAYTYTVVRGKITVFFTDPFYVKHKIQDMTLSPQRSASSWLLYSCQR